jgi:hypothetical protein
MTTFEQQAAALSRHLANEVAAGRLTAQQAGEAANNHVWTALKAAQAQQQQQAPPPVAADASTRVQQAIAAAFERRKEGQQLAELYELAAEEVAAATGMDVEQLFELALNDSAAAENLLTQAGFSEAAYEQTNPNDVQANAEAAGVDVQTFTGQDAGEGSEA